MSKKVGLSNCIRLCFCEFPSFTECAECPKFNSQHEIVRSHEPGVVWNVSKLLFKKFKKAPPGQSPESSRFVSGQNLDWYLEIYPNGLNDNDKGDCTLCLMLTSRLEAGESVVVHAFRRCEQINASSQSVTEYVLQRNGFVGCERTPSFSKLLNLGSVSFLCSIRILQKGSAMLMALL